MTTFAPSAAAARTIASPMPLFPPVTTTDLPCIQQHEFSRRLMLAW